MKKYLSGLLTGILCTVLAGSLIFAGYSYFIKNSDEDNSSTKISQEANSEKKEDSSLFTNTQLEEKIEYIRTLVDKIYLWDVTKEDYETGILKGLMESLDDPYSCYYTEEEYASLMESSSGVYCGIGAYVSQAKDSGIITIVKPFVDGPAYKAGILPGDIIYKVNGEEVTGEDLTTVVNNMKGEEGTSVTLSVMREGESDPVEYQIVRKEIEVPTISYEMLEDKIGYIYISEFDEVTVDQYIDAVDDLEKQGMVGLVVDVRDNPGGLYDACLEMLDRMLPKELLVYQENKEGERITESFAKDAKEFNLPLAVIVNGNSASAAEIFSGALQDYEKATIVGTQSFGKGIVQSVYPLPDGSAVKVTISKYFTPKGRDIHGTGIEPDVVVELNKDLKQKVVITHEEDNQLQTAIKTIKEKLK